jgi:hypothetical protein
MLKFEFSTFGQTASANLIFRWGVIKSFLFWVKGITYRKNSMCYLDVLQANAPSGKGYYIQKE